MNLVDRYLERKSEPSKSAFLLDEHVRREFKETRGRIAALMGQTEYWHGTGKLHYQHEGESKYDGVTDHVTNTFASIVTNGLEPRTDLYGDDGGIVCDTKETVSLTMRRMYARLYAAMYHEEGDSLQFEYGSRTFWESYFFGKMILSAMFDGFFDRNIIKKMLKGKPIKEKDKVQDWIRSFTKKNYGSGPLSIAFSMPKISSDIKGNHPVILGIEAGVVEPIPLKIKQTNMFESRHGMRIAPQSFTHIQVPFSRVQAVREELAGLGLPDLAVVPIEFAELIDSEASFRDLARPHKIY